MDVFNGVTNETIIFTIVIIAGVLISMMIAYRDGYKAGEKIGEHNGYEKTIRKIGDEYLNKPPTPPRQTKLGIIKPPEPPKPIPNRRNKKY